MPDPTSCRCHTGARLLGLVVGCPTDANEELLGAGAHFGWEFDPVYGILQIPIGGAARMADTRALRDFLLAVCGEPCFNELRATWLDPSRPLAEQAVALIHAERLVTQLPTAASRLLPLLQKQQLLTYFQPVLAAATGKIWGYECLMRGRDEQSELLFPADLLAWARAEDLLLLLDRVCRETHIGNVARCHPSADLYFLINFFPTVIYQPEFCLKTTLEAVQRVGLTPARLIFEIVETESITDTDHVLRVLDFYRKAGFGIALDDLGAGYAGLSWLGEIRPDLIKIDRGIISKAVESSIHRNIAKAIVDIGRAENTLVLAEGIETGEQANLMTNLGVDLFQGYYFGKPAPDLNR